MAVLVTACPAPHRTTKYTAVGSSAVSVFGLEDAGWADVLLEQSCLRCAKRLSGAHLPTELLPTHQLPEPNTRRTEKIQVRLHLLTTSFAAAGSGQAD